MSTQSRNFDPSKDICSSHHASSNDTSPAISLDLKLGLEQDQGASDILLSRRMEPEAPRGYIEKTNDDTENERALNEKPSSDGGFEAWLAVFGGFCGQLVSFGWINCIGVFQAYYGSHQLKDLPTSTVTWITSLEAFMMLFGAAFIGILFDNFGPRWILLAGTLLHVFGLMMTSISFEYYQFILAQGICSPIGASAIYHTSLNSVSTWFHRRRALALGIIASGSGLGGVILPIMVNHLIPQVGFPWTMRACAFLVLFMLTVSNLTIRSRLTHHRKPFHLLAFIHPLKERRFLLTTVAGFFFHWGAFLPFTFVATQAERYGMSPDLTSYLIPILNSASIFGRIVPPFLADVIGRFNMAIITTAISATLVVALWLPSHSNSPAIAFSVLYGFSSGAVISLNPAVVAQISNIREVGARGGTFFGVASIAALTGSPIAGALIPDALHDSYWKLQVFCAVVMFTGTVFYVLARISAGGFGLRTKV